MDKLVKSWLAIIRIMK